MLDQAKKQLIEILAIVDADVSAGTPIVVLEPSCASVFRDEARKLFPEREDVRRLSENTYLLGELLNKFVIPAKAGIQAPGQPLQYPNLDPRLAPTLRGDDIRAIVQLHCHHQAILDKTSEGAVLKRAGVDAEQLDAGCCGMAGAFGFNEKHYDLSMQIGERKLLPKVRETPGDHLIIADGFSCREQIEQATGRRTMHLAEVLAAVVGSRKG